MSLLLPTHMRAQTFFFIVNKINFVNVCIFGHSHTYTHTVHMCTHTDMCSHAHTHIPTQTHTQRMTHSRVTKGKHMTHHLS